MIFDSDCFRKRKNVSIDVCGGNAYIGFTTSIKYKLTNCTISCCRSRTDQLYISHCIGRFRKIKNIESKYRSHILKSEALFICLQSISFLFSWIYLFLIFSSFVMVCDELTNLHNFNVSAHNHRASNIRLFGLYVGTDFSQLLSYDICDIWHFWIVSIPFKLYYYGKYLFK